MYYQIIWNKFRDNAFFYKAINSVSVQVSKTFSLLRKARSLLLPNLCNSPLMAFHCQPAARDGISV